MEIDGANMRKLLITAALILLAPVMAIAQGLSIVGPTEPIEPKSPVWLTIVGVEQGASAVFFPSDQLQSGPPHIMPLSALFWAETAGTYRANAIVVDWSAQLLIPLTYTVVVGEDAGPDPPPPPPPADELWGLLIYEAHDLDDDPEFAKIRVSTRLRAIDKFTLQPYDKDATNEDGETPADLKPWLKLITDNNWALPQMLLVNEAGDLVAHKTPESVDGAIAFVEEHLE